MDGPLLIIAGPGSGKTRTLVHRIAYLLREGVPARQILALTFTNKAAEEMKNRIAKLAPGEAIWAGTFHKFGARLLRSHAEKVGLEPNYSIYDMSDSKATLKRAIQASKIELVHVTPEKIADRIGKLKGYGTRPDDFLPRSGDPLDDVVKRIYPLYQQQLQIANACDFDDLLLHTLTILKESSELRRSLDQRYKYVLVDEYQDTNTVQYAIARALSIDEPNLCAVGDPDQSIYGWRGANLNNILEFERDFPDARIVRLEQNYRSTKAILRAADALIRNNRRRKHKELFTENQEGHPIHWTMHPTETAEAEAIADRIAQDVANGVHKPSDFAILYRMNALSLRVEIALRARRIPYQIVQGFEFFQRQEIKDTLSYLHLLNNPRNDTAFLRVVNNPTRGIGQKSLSRLVDHANTSGLNLLDAARSASRVKDLPKKAAGSLEKFAVMMDDLTKDITKPVEEILVRLFMVTGYDQQYRQDDSPESEERLANLQELFTAAREFDQRQGGAGALEDFLEQTSLIADTDALDPEADRVKMMSLHASKGLEFPVVFIVAVEQGILPHEWSQDRPEGMEEERRLLFVGMTRAMNELWLSQARYRSFRGTRRMTVPSEFVGELPRHELEWHTPLGADPLDEAWQDSPDDGWPTRQVERDPEPIVSPVLPRVRTAAEMAGQTAAAGSTDPNQFTENMIVKHPEYGIGKIHSLSGTGPKRRAIVRFASAAGEKTFILMHSKLTPLGRSE